MTIICTGAILFILQFHNPQATSHVGLAFGSRLGNQFCVTASVTIICTGISISSRSPGGGRPPLGGPQHRPESDFRCDVPERVQRSDCGNLRQRWSPSWSPSSLFQSSGSFDRRERLQLSSVITVMDLLLNSDNTVSLTYNTDISIPTLKAYAIIRLWILWSV